MKTVRKFLTLTLMSAALGAISVVSTNAQDDLTETCKPIYENFLAQRKPDPAKAAATGKDFLAKCRAWTGQEEAIKYVEGQVPKLEKTAADKKDQDEIYTPYYASIPAKDWAKAFSLGKTVTNKNPDDVDHPIVLASIGFDLSIAKPPVDTYNSDTVSMAKLALQKMEQGKASGSGEFGNFKGYTYKNTACPDGKLNATGWMNYIIGDIMYNRMKQSKEALPYLYKASQTGCETKDKVANVYRNIGNYYVEEFVKIEKDKNAAYDVVTKTKKDDPTFADTEKKYLDLVALQKGYMERITDAFARGYKAAVNAKETPAFSNVLLNRSKEFYGFRFGAKPTVSFDSWLAGVSTKPFIDPTVAVTPIVEAPPTTAPTAMTAATDNSSPNSTSASTSSDTRPRTAPTTGKTTAATTTTAKPAAATTKAPAKKPAPKKKGTK